MKQQRWSERAKHPFVVGGNAALSILLIFMVAAAVMVEYGRQQFYGSGPLTSEEVVVVPRGLGVRQIADLLEEKGIIENKWTFVTGLQFTGSRGSLQAGEYAFPSGASMNDVMKIIASGKVIEHPVTIAEGLTSEQIVKRLAEIDVLSGEFRQIPPEGSLLPETYRVTRGTSREQMIKRMTAARDKALEEAWANRDPSIPVKSPFELLVLASIIEKETAIASERARVAAVFVNRLKKNMRLQSDPTIIYGLVGGKGSLGRPILRSEITRRSPYNTYVINGLPPGPIANVGREALEAAARPAKTDDLYFVADGSGGHAFASSYQEHRQNVAKWRAIERERGAAEADRVDPEDAEEVAPAAAGEASGRRG
ncbi:aminodeoxychorismate lyase [Agaricicola taiwanensis]|uniref:Endolytic murein transglycosylase n=1 Tax=Agaricicola taiwanensis TaxID=591372 RepID=A0A8J2YJG5_9RHOB|nr:endolytic transglycosylase MltG [Agaricicola taiwanensis]GGE46892.1 aminodeoxychorismate lyase [Agaricicola taiwanensis]